MSYRPLPLQNIPLKRTEPTPKPVQPVVDDTPVEPVLFDDNGDPVFPGGITVRDVKDAMVAAAGVGHYDHAGAMAKRHGLDDLCPACAEPLGPPQSIPGKFEIISVPDATTTSADLYPSNGTRAEIEAIKQRIEGTEVKVTMEIANTFTQRGYEIRLCKSCYEKVRSAVDDTQDLKYLINGLMRRTVL
jgi:hypothetical protein